MLRLPYILFLLLISQSLFAQNAVAFMGNNSGVSNPNNSSKIPAIVYIPFVLEGGMIFVDAELNGQKASFILDTGAPSLVLNDSEANKTNSAKVDGIQGSADVGEIQVQSFNWAGLTHSTFSALAMDMSAFEVLTGRNIKGLIGYEFFKDHELLLDFDNQMIRLTRMKRKTLVKKRQQESIPFEKLGHLPILKMKVNGKVGYFGLDTGSEVNIIHTRWQKKINNISIESNQIVGVDGAVKEVQSTWIKDTQIGRQAMAEMEFHFIDLSTIEKEYGVRLDGILGFPFFSTNKVALDFEKQKLTFLGITTVK